jgi:YbbR domain-containing protein
MEADFPLRLNPPMKIANILYRVFVYQYKIKLFCLFSALFFWFYISIESQFEYTTDVPLTLVNPPQGWILLDPLPQSAKVRFKGAGRSYFSYRFHDRKLEVDLRKVNNNTRIPLTADMVKDLPANVRVLAVLEPEAIKVQWDRLIKKKVPVLTRLDLAPADGYVQVGDIQLEPDSVTVTGPQSVADSIYEVSTESRTYSGLIKEIGDKLPLVPVSEDMLKYSAKIVKFRADIQKIGERTLEAVPVLAIHVPEGEHVSVRPSMLSIKLQGGVDVLAQLKKEDVSVTVDYRNLGRYPDRRIPAMIQMPKDVTFIEVEPKIFELAVSK